MSYCDHVLVHTGQNYDYELNQIFFDDLGSPQARSLPRQPPATAPAADDRQRHHRGRPGAGASVQPEALLVLGDTNSCLAAIPAKRRKIPIFHMEAGNRCFDQRVPEEINRRIVDHTADVNLTYSTIAREYLLREGLAAGSGDQDRQPDVRGADPLSRRGSSVRRAGAARAGSRSTISSSARTARRMSTPTDASAKLVEIAQRASPSGSAAGHRLAPTRAPGSGSTRAAARFDPQVRLLKPLGFLRLREAADVARGRCCRTAARSARNRPILNFPALNLREAHERPEAMEEAVGMMTGPASLSACCRRSRSSRSGGRGTQPTAAPAGRLRGAERLRQDRPHHPELHRLCAADGLEGLLRSHRP